MACPICPVGHATIFKDYIIPVVAAIMGALVAYLPLRLLARQTSRDMIVRDEKARREVELGLSRRAWGEGEHARERFAWLPSASRADDCQS